ncbi:Hypothetical protein GbCGDNIH9_0286 [Granulibacter bethesdensis]|uniref:Uncharacterized protein n=1 Tax=Granulibacter bethesdensis TaxID=364410 RepID=A0AAC9KB62_9PROT|nr:hypothetical protein [Granulibacter bethesdensis]APH53512.1 Hypothetical protein GbCGDNIH9_0286 [Granulibacter bethesdensis]APH61090.1 Hypothetical protein GbCGDNIH8_0286 [Granulibacter bethesdensis]
MPFSHQTPDARILALSNELNAATDMLRELVILLDRHLADDGRNTLHERLLTLRRNDRVNGARNGPLSHLAETLLTSLPHA